MVAPNISAKKKRGWTKVQQPGTSATIQGTEVLPHSATEQDSQKGFSSATAAEAPGISQIHMCQTNWKQRNTRLARFNIL